LVHPLNPLDSKRPRLIHEKIVRAGSWFGWSIASGDFNGDGKTDLAISAMSPSSNPFIDGTISPYIAGSSSANTGRVLVEYGPFENSPELVVGSPNSWNALSLVLRVRRIQVRLLALALLLETSLGKVVVAWQ